MAGPAARYSDKESDLKKRCMHLTNYSINVKKAGGGQVDTLPAASTTL